MKCASKHLKIPAFQLSSIYSVFKNYHEIGCTKGCASLSAPTLPMSTEYVGLGLVELGHFYYHSGPGYIQEARTFYYYYLLLFQVGEKVGEKLNKLLGTKRKISLFLKTFLTSWSNKRNHNHFQPPPPKKKQKQKP